jgi:hypothetical protein
MDGRSNEVWYICLTQGIAAYPLIPAHPANNSLYSAIKVIVMSVSKLDDVEQKIAKTCYVPMFKKEVTKFL